MKKYFLISIFVFLFSFNFVNALSTTGFIPGQIWYSKDSLIEGDTVKIYTAIWNSNTSSLSAKVEFYDKNVILGTRDVVIPSEQLGNVSISWKVTAGDHIISAKIISSSLTNSGKKNIITLDNNLTKGDHLFVPVVIKDANGNIATSSDVVQSQIDKANSFVSNILPPSIVTPISNSFDSIDTFRDGISNNISTAKEETQNKIDSYNKTVESPKTVSLNLDEDQKKAEVQSSNPIDEPIAYVKLFLLSIVGFIFGNKIVFYGLTIFVIFYVLRFLYFKIRNR